MEKYSCEEALDYVLAHVLTLNQTEPETFVTNVTAQVVERHMVRGLDKIFSPMDVNGMSDGDDFKIASEPLSTRVARDLRARAGSNELVYMLRFPVVNQSHGQRV